MNTMSTTKTYVAYYRVSTQEQANSNLGLEAQERDVTNYINSQQGALLKSFTDAGVSGTNNEREGLNNATKYARKTGSTLVINKLDRLSRDMAFTVNYLRDAPFPIVCTAYPTADNFMLNIHASVAQNERDLISQRTKAALQSKKDQGIKLGGRQLGAEYHEFNDEDLIKSAVTRRKKAVARLNDWLEEIQEAYEMIQQGWTYNQAAKWLSDQGMRSARGSVLKGNRLSDNIRMLKKEGILV